ncbi:PHA-depolymerase-like protein [Burkholderia ubonensis]|uniref:extracellular catalytic domain type 2 short-chain-length polyhydroxyalkanoate depolymerase n=1 Tax=Burkholderia ubonensis TaxID=101571 RepID=UPI000B12F75C|nr:PHA-depolymerase-like protein [Burkholderia ubonensis]
MSNCTVFRRALCIGGLVAGLAQSVPLSAQVAKLPAFNVDIKQTSVSGLSSGGFMAVQFDVAYSSIVKGAGIIAGGPYACSQGSLVIAMTACMDAIMPTDIPTLIRITNANARSQAIDSPANLANQKIWMFSGSQDSVVMQSVMNDLRTYYRHFISAANIKYVKNIRAEHAMPTDFFGNTCDFKGNPFINNCHFDASGELLKWIYGPLNPRNTGSLDDQRFIEFDQSEFIGNPRQHSMADTGWIYVPANCANGQACRLHVVFHGCFQYPAFSEDGATFGTTYVRNTGYNQWADTNNIIVLYPQLFIGQGDPETLSNPNGCWDWFAYDDPNFATKTGNQMKAVKAMIDRISSGAQ